MGQNGLIKPLERCSDQTNLNDNHVMMQSHTTEREILSQP